MADTKKGSYSVEGIWVNEAFGYLGKSKLNPWENARIAGRKIKWLLDGAKGNERLAAGRFTAWKGGRFEARMKDWDAEGGAYKKFFACYTAR